MIIINDEFVTVPSGVTIRISDICGIHVDAGKIFARWLGVEEWFALPTEDARLTGKIFARWLGVEEWFALPTEDARLLLDQWIRVTSARMGIHYSPAENPRRDLTSCP